MVYNWPIWISPEKLKIEERYLLTEIYLCGKRSKEVMMLVHNLLLIGLNQTKLITHNSKSLLILYHKNGSKIIELIQVTYSSSKSSIENRGINNLIEASNQLHCSNLLVITWDYEAEEKIKEKKIKFIPLWKWLLNL